MRALRLYAGPRAMRQIARDGLQAADIGTVAGAAGGPKGLILGPLDRFVFGQWLAQSAQQVHLVGASIGAWRMATACLEDNLAAFARLEYDYIHQDFELGPGIKRPTPDMVSELFGRNLRAFYGSRAAQVLGHPRYRLHVVTARGRHLLGRDHGWRTPVGYLGAFLTNSVHRRAMGAWLERVVFSSAGAALPFDSRDYRTRQVALS
ncbi:MAG: phospholipase, partial [Betaproteobacteria bacterium]